MVARDAAPLTHDDPATAVERLVDDAMRRLAERRPLYDTLKDVVRLERLTEAGNIDVGCVVALTNLARLWTPPAAGARLTAFDAFRLHDGRRLHGELHWGPTAGSKTKENREDPIRLRGTYTARWRDYAHLGPKRTETLRHLPLVVA